MFGIEQQNWSLPVTYKLLSQNLCVDGQEIQQVMKLQEIRVYGFPN